jgi:3-oxoacyl-[acyl-carrier-protein] synthase III
MYQKAYIPFRGYYSSPFSRWQGKLQNENAIELGAATAKRWLATKNFDPAMIDYVVFGKTIGQYHSFYASPWAGAMLGAEKFLRCISPRLVPLPPPASIWRP